MGFLTTFYIHYMHAYLQLLTVDLVDSGRGYIYGGFSKKSKIIHFYHIEYCDEYLPPGGFLPCSVRVRPACSTHGGNPGQKSVSTTSLEYRFIYAVEAAY